MRFVLALLAAAALSLVASSLLWLRAERRRGPPPDASILAAFEAAAAHPLELDVARRFAGRAELLDPRAVLPSWHRFPREEAVRVHAALRSCPPPPLAGPVAPALAKAHRWHAATCAGAAPPDELVGAPPFVHPSGRSYASLAGGGQARDFHVLELASLPAERLDPEDRGFAALGADVWEALARGDAVALTRDHLVVPERSSLGLAKVRLHPRRAWESFARGRSAALRPRVAGTSCARPASPDLCWEALSVAERRAPLLAGWTFGSAAALAAATVALGALWIRDRRRAHRDRIHVLRTLTHELRTPAASLRVDLEPLRSAYDELPPSCQEPVLRVSDAVERLLRVLHRSARYLALFETEGAARLVRPREVASTREMLARFAEEWPEGVTLEGGSADAPVVTDEEWLGVAVRNLVENASRHGAPPVRVKWTHDGGWLSIEVSDGGSSEGLTLSRAALPWERSPRSAGLGLGLAIVLRVAQLLGGRLSHRASPTTFELRVPARAEAA